MSRKIQHKRGLKQNLPQLDVAELGFTTDTEELFIGGDEENVQLAKKKDLEKLATDVAEDSQAKANRALSDAKEYADELEPDLTGYATEEYVDDTVNKIDKHSHDNKNVIDKLTDVDGKLEYDGQAVGSVTSVNGQIGDVEIPEIERMSKAVTLSDGVIDVSAGAVFTINLDSSTSFLFNAEPDKRYQSFKLILKTGSSAHPIIFPSGVKWHEDSTPELSQTETTYILEFITEDSGTSWYGRLIFTDFKKLPEGYVWAVDDDFSGAENSDFKYIGSGGKIAIPHVIKGVPVTTYYNMFRGNDNVLGVYSDNSSVTNMSFMFSDSQVTTLDLSSFDTSSVTDMYSMFRDSQATVLDLSSFDTSSVTNMGFMFSGSQATVLDLSSFDTSSVTSMSFMFSDSQATTGYARTQEDADKFNVSSGKPSTLNFVVK